jgi:hypothetical protein
MSDRLLLATFDHEDDVLGATRAAREQGYTIRDVYAPYAIHGIDRAMGLRPTRLTWVCFILGMIGALGMFWFQHWTAAIAWPIDVGGKPWNSLPSDVPVAFETMILLAGLGTVFALLVVSRLYPGKTSLPPIPQVTNDRFVLVLDELDASYEIGQVRQLLADYDVKYLEERTTIEGSDA